MSKPKLKNEALQKMVENVLHEKPYDYGKCACCDEKATIYCHELNNWVCGTHYIRSGITFDEWDYYTVLQDVEWLKKIIHALCDEVARQSERIEELVELRSTVIDIYLDMKCSRQRDFPLKAWRETLDKFGLLENPNDDTEQGD